MDLDDLTLTQAIPLMKESGTKGEKRKSKL